jgi:hypothetical protein
MITGLGRLAGVGKPDLAPVLFASPSATSRLAGQFREGDQQARYINSAISGWRLLNTRGGRLGGRVGGYGGWWFWPRRYQQLWS